MVYQSSWYLTMVPNLPPKSLQSSPIKHIFSAPYHLATNGQVERFVETFKQAMKVGKESEGVTSNQRLCEFLLSYRTTPHSVTKVAPCMLFLKRDVRTRLHLLRGCLESEMAENQMDQKVKYMIRIQKKGPLPQMKKCG